MSTINKYMLNILKYVVENKATDLHICVGSKPFMRLNLKLVSIRHMEVISSTIVEDVLYGLLNEHLLKELELKKSVDFSFSIEDLSRFRVNVYFQRGDYAIAIRILPLNVPDFKDLGISETVKAFAQKLKGLYLITGTTGSGKSTTIASIIDMINESNHYHITTIEDPIEYFHINKKSLVTQREIGRDAISFSSAIRDSLREDPDVIMVGEMRDLETISIALTAAETGHLVFSTLHTVGAVKSIDRIIDSFPAEQQNQICNQLSTVLEGIVSQQFIPRIDSKGIVVATEIMIVNSAIRNLIRERKYTQINSIIQTGMSQGMHTLEKEMAKYCKLGVISKEEALLRAYDTQLFMQFLNNI